MAGMMTEAEGQVRNLTDIRKSAVIMAAAAVLMCACGGSPAPVGEAGTEAEYEEESFAVMETDVEKERSSSQGETTAEGDFGKEPQESLSPADLKLSCISTDKILELADKDRLSWTDLEDYQCQDGGSGMMILSYDVNKDFCLIAGGPGFDEEPMYIRLVSEKDEDYIDIREASSLEVRDFLEKHGSSAEQVGIRGHVKEIHGDRILISSDIDDFPGAFWVLGISEALLGEELQGGMSVLVLMEDMGRKAEDGIEEYKALEVYEASKEETTKTDILLTAPPVLGLSDPLSSIYASFEVQAGDYSWNTTDGQGIIACGAWPLEEAVIKSGEKLKIPSYNGVEKVLYGYFMQVWPDKLTVSQWDVPETGNVETEKEWMVTFYCRMPFIELGRGKIYEFAAEWKKENSERNGFWGDARYSFVTE